MLTKLLKKGREKLQTLNIRRTGNELWRTIITYHQLLNNNNSNNNNNNKRKPNLRLTMNNITELNELRIAPECGEWAAS
jgi:hypothetical protein